MKNLIAFLACIVLLSCTSSSLRQQDEKGITWGPAAEGVSCGIGLSQQTYVTGEDVAVRVYLKNANTESITCNVSNIQTWRNTPEGPCTLALLVDATGDQYMSGRKVVIPPGQTIQIVSQAFPTRHAGNRMSDLHFAPGFTPIRVICTPLFNRKDGPLLSGNLSGVSSGVAEAQVLSGETEE